MFEVPSRTNDYGWIAHAAGPLGLFVLVPIAFGLGPVLGTAAMAAGICAVGWLKAQGRLASLRSPPSLAIAATTARWVEIHGKAGPLDERPLRDPVTREPCLWFGIETYALNQGRRYGDVDNWEIVERVCSSRDFIISDDTGSCRVQVAGATIELAQPETVVGASGKLRHVLHRIRRGDTIFVRGRIELRADTSGDAYSRSIRAPASGNAFLIADHTPEYEVADLESRANTYLIALAISAAVLIGLVITGYAS